MGNPPLKMNLPDRASKYTFLSTHCSICKEYEETRFFSLYVFGSEGIYLCHSCEMKVVEFIRELACEKLETRIRIHNG